MVSTSVRGCGAAAAHCRSASHDASLWNSSGVDHKRKLCSHKNTYFHTFYLWVVLHVRVDRRLLVSDGACVNLIGTARVARWASRESRQYWARHNHVVTSRSSRGSASQQSGGGRPHVLVPEYARWLRCPRWRRRTGRSHQGHRSTRCLAVRVRPCARRKCVCRE